MKKILISAVAIVAIVLVAFQFNGFVLLGLVVLLPVIVFRKRLRKDAACATRLLTMEEAVARYGDPDDSIIVDATCANEAAGCILVFKQKRMLVVAGEPISMDDITDVATVNTATPYTIGQYQLVLTTKRPESEYVRMNAGLDAGWAREVATQVIDVLRR